MARIAFPNGTSVPRERYEVAGQVVDSYAGYMVTTVPEDERLPVGALSDRRAAYWEVWSVTTGRLRRYDTVEAAWAHYVRLVKWAKRRDDDGLRLTHSAGI